MRFLSTGDIQACKFKQFSVTLPNGMNSRLANILKIFRILRKEGTRRGIKRILINGDLFEETNYPDMEVYTAVYQELEKCQERGFDVVLNVGNHDVILKTEDRMVHSLLPFRKVANVIDKPTLVWGELLVLPYESSRKLLDRLGKIKNWKKSFPEVLVLHAGIQGAVAGPKDYLVRNPIKLKDICADKFHLVLLSDFHKRQWLAKNVLYMGSPLQHSFGETHDPCIWEIRLYGKAPYFKAIPILTNLPRFIRIQLRSTRDISRQVGEMAGNYVRIEVVSINDGEPDPINESLFEKLSKEYSFLYQIKRRTERNESQGDSIESFHPSKMIKRYLKVMGVSKQRRKRLKILGERLYYGHL